MPFLTADELRQSIADSLQTPIANLPARWGRHATRSVEDGKRDIIEIMTAKGYTLSQILDWPRLTSIHESQSKYWAFVHGGLPQNFDDRWVNKLDMRKEMRENLVITADGGVVVGTGEPGFVVSGRLDSEDDEWSRNTKF